MHILMQKENNVHFIMSTLQTKCHFKLYQKWTNVQEEGGWSTASNTIMDTLWTVVIIDCFYQLLSKIILLQ